MSASVEFDISVRSAQNYWEIWAAFIYLVGIRVDVIHCGTMVRL